MPAPKGNEFWKLRSSHGRKPIFKNPEELESAINEYFEQTSERTWDEQHWVGKDGDSVTKFHPAPFTVSGLCIFLDIDQSTLWDYEKKKGFTKVVTRAKEIIYTQKFEGAATGFFNQNIIARDLGLRDKQDHTSSDGSMTPKIELNYNGKKINLKDD